jgi:hypothetical protein
VPVSKSNSKQSEAPAAPPAGPSGGDGCSSLLSRWVIILHMHGCTDDNQKGSSAAGFQTHLQLAPHCRVCSTGPWRVAYTSHTPLRGA